MDILTNIKDGVLTIELNRPDKKNAITAAMYQSMTTALANAEAEPAVRVVLFQGKPETFTAGNDVEDFLKRPPAGEDSPVYRFLRTVSSARKPLVAAVNGTAVGIGTTLLFHCDLVYVGDSARFSMPFTSLGLVPEFASSYLLPMIAGYQRAAELMLLGEPFGAEKAKEAGFVTAVLPSADVLPTAQRAAAKLASLPGESVRNTKALLKRAHQKAVEEQLRAEAAQFIKMLNEPAAKEAFSAFLEKRKPDFSKFE